jgi:hypothetical protein
MADDEIQVAIFKFPHWMNVVSLQVVSETRQRYRGANATLCQ